MESKNSFTPGPWRIAPASDYQSGINIDAGKHGYICLIGHPEAPNAKADARLIAAAPDMYDLLYLIDGILDAPECESRDFPFNAKGVAKDIHDILAKIDGGQQ